MKSAMVLFALVTAVAAKDGLTAYGYLIEVGMPLANLIRDLEAKHIEDRLPVNMAEIPYQAGLIASIQQGEESVCIGSLVNEISVITAAHCWYDGQTEAESFTVVLGSANLFSGGSRFITNNVTQHIEWNPRLVRNDIAIVFLPNPVSFSNVIKPIALPSGNEVRESFVKIHAVISGYILTQDEHKNYAILSSTKLPVISNDECSYTFGLRIVSSNLCTSGAYVWNIYNGGSPLVITRYPTHILIGIHSFQSAHGKHFENPAVYTRVTSYLPWIYAQLDWI